LTEAIETAVKRVKISAALFGNREPQEKVRQLAGERKWVRLGRRRR
jgi:hypothetical protein